MWPSIFGPGWGWGLLIALAFLCFVLGVLGFLLVIFNRPSQKTGDSLDRLWHRYEEGDLTREEFERLRRPARSQSRVQGATE
jgi:hypothetical protein